MKESVPSRMMAIAKTAMSDRLPRERALPESMLSVTSRSSPPAKNATTYVAALIIFWSQENSPPFVELMAAKYPFTTNARMPMMMTAAVKLLLESRLLASPNSGAMKTVAA